jgi:hypothetical protein
VDLTGCPPDDAGVRQRVRYFFGMLMGEDDFNQEQAYLLAKARRHNRMLHGWGIVAGLEVSALGSEGRHVSVAPGYALDPCGNEISVEESVLVEVPYEGMSFVVVGFEEIVVSEARVRDSFTIRSLRDPGEPWVVLAAITADRDNGLAIDTSVRRRLTPD